MASDKLNIKSWDAEDRPREKLMLKGKEALSEAELLAILIGSGNKDQTAVGLAKSILNHASNNLHELGKMDLDELMTFKGIGEAKAITIAAALEIGRRRLLTDTKENTKISSSRDAYNAISPILADYHHEEFWILLLNRSLKIIKKVKISVGGISMTVVDPKIIFKHAIQSLASSIILVHNHPSGNLKPSREDIQVTEKLKNAGKLLDISVTDHLIIAQSGYFSFADEGMM